MISIDEHVLYAQAEEVVKAINQIPTVLDATTKDAADTIRDRIKQRTTIGYWYIHPGQAREGWGEVTKIHGGYAFSNPVDYIQVLSYGHFRLGEGKMEGPHTIRIGGNVYSKFTVNEKGRGVVDPVLSDLVLLQEILDGLVANIKELFGVSKAAQAW
jgi:hypothetical protein